MYTHLNGWQKAGIGLTLLWIPLGYFGAVFFIESSPPQALYIRLVAMFVPLPLFWSILGLLASWIRAKFQRLAHCL